MESSMFVAKYLNLVNKNSLFLLTEIIYVLIKIFLLKQIWQGRIGKGRFKANLLIGVILTSILADFSLLFYSLSFQPFYLVSKLFHRSFSRIEGAAWTAQFLSFVYFSREISSSKVSHKTVLPWAIPAILLVIPYIYRSIAMLITKQLEYTHFDILMDQFGSIYVILAGIVSMAILYRNYRTEKIELLKRHNKILLLSFMIPYFISKMFDLALIPLQYNFTTINWLSFLTTFVFSYNIYKLMGLRFLNINKQVTASSSERVLLLSDFRETIEQFYKAKNGSDLVKITKEFFGEAFGVPKSKVHLILKGRLKFNKEEPREVQIARAVLNRLLDPEDGNHGVRRLIEQKKVLITDEVEFSNFSEPELAKSEPFKEVLGFLQHANVDVVIPLFCAGNFSGAIVLDKNCRNKKLFNTSEQDQMLLFSEHLAHVMYELIYEDPEVLLEERQQLESNLYKSKQLLSSLKSGIDFFIKQGPTEKLGVLVYKNKKFTYCNKDAHDLLTVDLNKDKGLDFTKEIYAKALHTAQFFVEHKIILEDPSGNLLAFKFAPNVKKDNTIVTITKPNISDVIKEDCNLLDQPSQWNTLLALRSTEEGKVVDDFLPAQSKQLLNFKVSLLEKAMTRKFLVFDLADEDVESFAHVVHNISKRNRMEEVDARESGLSEKLFGVNGTSKGLLNALDKTGTLVVRNFHRLDKELQKKFYKLITSGTYNPMQGEEQLKADVLIIFSSNQNLHNLETEKLISKELASALALGEVSLPAFSSMDEEEVVSLSEGLRNKLVVNKLYANLLILTDVDKKKILASNCASLYELKAKVKHLVFLKTKKEGIKASKAVDPAYEVADFELMDIARLGKDALKDPRAIEKLVSKFNGNQSHIAEFLGVHRSSVCRRVEQCQRENSEKKNLIKAADQTRKQ